MAGMHPGASEPVDGVRGERTVSELGNDALDDLRELVRLQQELAKLELRREGTRIGLGTGAFVFVLLLLHLVLILGSVTVGLVLWETTMLSAWVSFLIVTGGYLLLLVVLGLFGWWQFRRLQGMPRSRAAFGQILAALRRNGTGEDIAVAVQRREAERA